MSTRRSWSPILLFGLVACNGEKHPDATPNDAGETERTCPETTDAARPDAAIDAGRSDWPEFEAFARGGTPGAAVLAFRDGEVLAMRGFGEATLDTHTPIDEDTLFNLASNSKQFTAAMALLLETRGELRFSDPISRFLPSLPAWSERVTIADLVFHTGALPDYMSICEGTEDRTNADVLDFLERTEALEREPGTTFEYSNTGYAVLASVLEAAAETPYPALLERDLFTPLGMTSSFVFVASSRATPRALGYGDWPDFADDEEDPCNTIYGDGSIYTSVRDYAVWITALETPTRLFSATDLERVWTSGTLRNGDAVDYALGWNRGRYAGRDIVWHGGSWVGFRSSVVQYVDENLWVVVFSNARATDVDHWSDVLAARFLE